MQLEESKANVVMEYYEMVEILGCIDDKIYDVKKYIEDYQRNIDSNKSETDFKGHLIAMINKHEQQVKDLEGLKKSLINRYVTGKIKEK